MSNVQLSSNIDCNKVFLRKRSELESRLDPYFYSDFFKFNIDLIKKNRYKRLKDLISFSNEIWDQKNLFGEHFPYLEISGINLDTGVIRDLDIREKSSAPSRAKMLIRHGDILVSTTRPTRGAITHYSDNNIIIASTGFAVIRKVNENIINRLYLFYILRLYFSLLQMGQRSSGGNYPAITQEELGNIYIPIPMIEKQIKIVQLLQNSYKFKQKKEQEAQDLLDSIDDYLMKELGVKLPEVGNSLKHRIFKTSFSMCQGNRLDSYYHQTKFDLYFEAFKKSVYPVQKLKNITSKITSGITPTSGGKDYVSETDGIPFIRSGDIEISGNIDLSSILYISENIHNTEMKSSQLKENDILIAIVGATIGQVGIYKYQYEANINQAIALVRLQDGYNPNYIKEILKSFVGQINLEHLKRPVARANINLQEISQIQLIIPLSLEKQSEIASHIQSIREKAKQLQNEAQQQFEQTKKEIEQMILGENL